MLIKIKCMDCKQTFEHYTVIVKKNQAKRCPRCSQRRNYLLAKGRRK